MKKNDAILITGGAGLVGKNLAAFLQSQGYANLLTPGAEDCDLVDRAAVAAYFEKHKPAFVFHLAGRVRGLMGNMKAQGDAYLENTLINTHVVDAAQKNGVKKIVAMGTVAMYPDPLPHNPLRETDIWMGKPHESEYGYGQAKRGMLAQLEAYHDNYGLSYAVAFSTNLFGPYDRFNTTTGHVIPSLVKKFYDAGRNSDAISIWGDGSAQRDFLYIKDCVRALALIMDKFEGAINLATGRTQKIKDAVNILAAHTGMADRVVWDASKPNGQIVRAYDVARLTGIGFAPEYTLEQALRETYDWYAANVATARS